MKGGLGLGFGDADQVAGEIKFAVFLLGEVAVGDRPADQEQELLDLAAGDPVLVEVQGAGVGHQLGPVGLGGGQLVEKTLHLLLPLGAIVDGGILGRRFQGSGARVGRVHGQSPDRGEFRGGRAGGVPVQNPSERVEEPHHSSPLSNARGRSNPDPCPTSRRVRRASGSGRRLRGRPRRKGGCPRCRPPSAGPRSCPSVHRRRPALGRTR